MTVTHGANGAGTNGTDSAALPYPTGITSAHQVVAIVAFGNDAEEEPPAPSGWTLDGVVVGGETVDGTPEGAFVAYSSGQGPRGLALYHKDTVAGGESGTVTFNNSGGTSTGRVIRGFIRRLTKTDGYWVRPVLMGAMDIVDDTSWVAAALSDLGGETGDLLWTAHALATTGTPSMSSPSSPWPGTTGTRTSVGSGSASGGHAVRLLEYWQTVDSGPSTGPPSFAATLSAAASGATAFIRFRDSNTLMVAGSDATNIEPHVPRAISGAGSVGYGAVTWTQVAGTTGVIASPSSLTTTFEPAGTLTGDTVTLRLTDNTSGIYDEVTFTVLPAVRRVMRGGTIRPVKRVVEFL